METSLLTSIVLKRNVTVMDIVSTRMLGQFGFLGKVRLKEKKGKKRHVPQGFSFSISFIKFQFSLDLFVLVSSLIAFS
jgi:hypothetical protein